MGSDSMKSLIIAYISTMDLNPYLVANYHIFYQNTIIPYFFICLLLQFLLSFWKRLNEQAVCL